MVDKKRVLLLAPPYMDIYKDIISCLQNMDYDVVWIEDCQIKGNPYNKKDITRDTKSKEVYEKEVNEFWDKKLNEIKNEHTFDYLLVIDGLMVSLYFFHKFREINPEVKMILYLYDRVKGNYEIEHFFKEYDRIYTFDKQDSSTFGISHLPIYWVPTYEKKKEIYDLFGMASFNSMERYNIFNNIRNKARQDGMKEYIKLWRPPVEHPFKYFIKYVLCRIRGMEMLSLSQLRNDIFTEKCLSPDDFRLMTSQSKVILDTSLSYQDGLTARFMWALGAEKKIITTNGSVKEYEFYDPKQVLILHDNYDEIINFIKEPYHSNEEQREIIFRYRIDNWIKTLFDSNS